MLTVVAHAEACALQIGLVGSQGLSAGLQTRRGAADKTAEHTMGAISALFTDLRKPSWRFLVLQEMLRMIPGEFGFEIRAKLLGRRFERVGPGLRVFPGARLFGVDHLKVGAHCWIGLDNTIQAHGGVEIGDHVLLGPGVKIWSVNHVFADPNRPIIDQGYEHKPVVIGSNVWIGANTFIMPGAHIGDGVVVSAGAVVGAKHIEPYSVVAGNPGRRIGSRFASSAVEDRAAGSGADPRFS